MAEVTEKDLDKKRESLAKLREQIAEAEATAAGRVQEQSNAIEFAQLDAEEARLKAQLAAAREAAKASAAKSGAAGPLASVTEERDAASQGITPPGVTVDTNAGSNSADKNEE